MVASCAFAATTSSSSHIEGSWAMSHGADALRQ